MKFSDLPVAIAVAASDQFILEQASTQGGPTTTKRATASLIIPPTIGFTLNNQAGTNYNAIRTDGLNTIIRMSNGAANTVTLQNDSTILWQPGDCVIIRQLGSGSGLTSFLAGAGVTINTPGTLICRVQYSLLAAIHETANTWYVCGDFK